MDYITKIRKHLGKSFNIANVVTIIICLLVIYFSNQEASTKIIIGVFMYTPTLIITFAVILGFYVFNDESSGKKDTSAKTLSSLKYVAKNNFNNKSQLQKKYKVKNKIVSKEKKEVPKTELQKIIEQASENLKIIMELAEKVADLKLYSEISEENGFVKNSEKLFSIVREKDLSIVKNYFDIYLPTCTAMLEQYVKYEEKNISSEEALLFKVKVKKTFEDMNEAVLKMQNICLGDDIDKKVGELEGLSELLKLDGFIE